MNRLNFIAAICLVVAGQATATTPSVGVDTPSHPGMGHQTSAKPCVTSDNTVDNAFDKCVPDAGVSASEGGGAVPHVWSCDDHLLDDRHVASCTAQRMLMRTAQ